MRDSARWPGTTLLALAALVALPGCGHRGDPLPPLRHTPPGLAEFRLAQRGETLEISALAPGASVDGIPYERLVVELLHAEGTKDLEKAGTRRELEAYARQRVAVTLPLPPPGTIVRAAARGIAGGEKGPRTLTMAIVVQPLVSEPSELRARLVAAGVELAWAGVVPEPVDAAVKPPRPPGMPGLPGAAGAPGAEPGAPPAAVQDFHASPGSSAPPGALSTGEAGARVVEPRKAGFHVYRRVGTESYRLPLAQEPLADRRATDETAPRGATACYVVRAVASSDPLVESAASNEACVEVRDIEPPAAPGGLAVLPRDAGLEVLWTPSSESDLGGYRVYREAPGEPRRKLADVEPGRSSWLDTSARAGVSYLYSVTAVDLAGNESPEPQRAEGGLP